MKQKLITSMAKLRNQHYTCGHWGGMQTAARPPYIVEPLHAEYREGRKYELIKPFVFYSAIVGMVTVEPGYITDFHSIPRMFWSVLPPDDWAEAAVAHDKLCVAHRADNRSVTYHEAAAVHRECSLHIGSPEWRAQTMWWAIDTFGPKW